jgi:uncharacterized protein (TIGR02145 family)
MNQNYKKAICSLVVIGLVLILAISCSKKEDTNTLPVNAHVPGLETIVVHGISGDSAITGGKIPGIYGGQLPIIARGVCWCIGHTPTLSDSKTIDGTGKGQFTSVITNLIPDTTYTIRAYATNSSGTGYGNQYTIRTISEPKTVVDADGNVYHTVVIGTQLWMAENLRTTKYNDGTPIPLITDGFAWMVSTTPAVCWYNNDSVTYKKYGALYNGYAVITHKLAPLGWHVATGADMNVMFDYLGDDPNVGWKLKTPGTDDWLAPNEGSDNISGFTALPGGYIMSNNFSGTGSRGVWWITFNNETYLNSMWVSNFNGGIPFQGAEKFYGLSVRCIKN